MINRVNRIKFSRVYGIFTAIIIVWMLYANYTGCRMFQQNPGRSWNANGPGGHK